MTALHKLIAELGENVVITEPSRLDAMRTDRSGWVAGGRPLALIEARTVEDVQATMRIAYNTGTPVVPRGAGSGLAGGANGTDGSIVISVERMNQILAISPEDEYAIVEPGLINAELNVSLRQHGLWFVPDPASKNTPPSAATSPPMQGVWSVQNTGSPEKPYWPSTSCCRTARSCTPVVAPSRGSPDMT
jgi:glycolate oxidase